MSKATMGGLDDFITIIGQGMSSDFHKLVTMFHENVYLKEAFYVNLLVAIVYKYMHRMS